MGTCVLKIPHSCGTKDALQVFAQDDGTLDGFCYACKTWVPNPLGGDKRLNDIPKAERIGKSADEIAAEIAEIAECEAVDLPDRRLRGATLEKFGIKVGLSEKDGKTPTFLFFPYTKSGLLVGYKSRLIEAKRLWSVGDLKGCDLFGWEQAKRSGATRLVVTEGELDACALDRIFEIYEKEEYKHTIPAIVSLPAGAGCASKVLAKHMAEINKLFKEISFCFDDDEPGRKALADACALFPLATSINLPCKDANACLMEGKGKEAYQAAKWKASTPKNSSLVTLDSVWEKAKEPAAFGVSWPWKHVTDVTRGIRTGETIYIGAAQKMGKSEVVNSLAAHIVVEHDWKILLAKPEEANAKTAKLLAGKIAHARFHDPKVAFDEEKFERAGSVLLGEKVFMLNLYQHLGWASLKTDITVAAHLGVKAVFIDPITNLTNGMNAGDANTKLQEIAQELAAMAKDLDIVVFIFCHLRNPDGGPDHDRGGHVLTSQFAGSRAMGRSCNYMFGIEGNKDPELPEDQRNVRHLVLLDDREYGESGSFGLFWDKETTMFNELEH